MRGLTSMIVLIVVLAGLGAYIYFVDSRKPAGSSGAGGITSETPKDKVFAVEADKIQELRVTADQQTSVLKKANGTWQMVEPGAADVDQGEASGVANALTSLEINRVVEENPSDLSQYGLAQPKLKVGFKAENGGAGEIDLGEKTPSESDMYAMKAGEKRVFLVPSYHESSFNKKPFDLRDKRALTIKRDDVDLFDVTGDADYQFRRSGTDWKVTRPVQARGDYSTVEGLITRVAGANMTSLVEQAPSAGALAPEVLAKYGLDKPNLTVTIGAGSAKAMLALGTIENSQQYARDLSRPMIFTLDPTLAADIEKNVGEFRNKNVVDFRPFNLDRLRVTRGADTYEFQKTAATANQPDRWQLTKNAGAAADVDAAKMDDFLSKITNLRIESFVEGSPGPPELVVAASYDQGKFERVRIGKSGTDVLVTREGEPGAGRLTAANYDDTLKALDAVAGK